MRTSAKTFDAVAESRKWKEAVAKETAGMTVEQTIAYFNRAAVRRRFKTALEQAKQTDKETKQMEQISPPKASKSREPGKKTRAGRRETGDRQ